MSIWGDVFETKALAVAKSAESGKLIFVVRNKFLPAAAYLPAVLNKLRVIELRNALTKWLVEERVDGGRRFEDLIDELPEEMRDDARAAIVWHRTGLGTSPKAGSVKHTEALIQAVEFFATVYHERRRAEA